MDTKEKMAKGTFYLTGMHYDDSLLQSYRLIFIALESILFAFALAILEDNRTWVILVAVVGIICAILWCLICHHRGKEVWAWKEELRKTVTGTEIRKFLDEWWEGKNGRCKNMVFVHGLARYVFNYIFPAVVFLVWMVLLFPWIFDC